MPLVPVESGCERRVSPYLWVGTTGVMVEQLQAYRERWGISHYTVRPDALPVIEPIISELGGR